MIKKPQRRKEREGRGQKDEPEHRFTYQYEMLTEKYNAKDLIVFSIMKLVQHKMKKLKLIEHSIHTLVPTHSQFLLLIRV
ncbi:hypothetical protein F7734_14590 [Scytonema sp. UIC 10036]|uniref:hypothetical protein n=1 Tax=Scytonema sp. UIC 10036 TaxID=2304196 RepID=UPI0012DAC53F|nr:hypothetical protein [Scytonema sp. UIC 10036]MUG93584.1 hypothetical protein [Scytonema sp. UIC 10036]